MSELANVAVAFLVPATLQQAVRAFVYGRERHVWLVRILARAVFGRELKAVLQLASLLMVDVQQKLHGLLELEHIVLVDHSGLAQQLVIPAAIVRRQLVLQTAVETLELSLKRVHL